MSVSEQREPQAEPGDRDRGRRPVADLLEILVFTYDRAERLRQTLSSLEGSPFSQCRITVLDNCSLDHTPEVCREFVERLPALRVIRHPRNIGLGANYLRAVEVSRARYSWILSDDEKLALNECGDVIDAIEEGEVDLISLGSPGQQAWERGLRTTTQDLMARGQRFFWVWTFAAGVIFKTLRFDDHCLQEGYRELQGDYAHFPHFEFLYQSLRGDASVYVSERACVSRSEGSTARTSATPLSFAVEAVRPTRRIAESEWRVKVLYESTPTRRAWTWDLAVRIVVEKLEHPRTLWKHLAELMLLFPGPQRRRLAALMPLALIPRPALIALRRGADLARRIRTPAPKPPES